MTQDCMKCKTMKETKACLRRKIAQGHDAKTKFHTGVRDAVLLSKDAIIDFKLTELTDNVNRLAAQRKFSVGRFFCDLLLAVAVGPVLGSLVGHLAIRPLNAIRRSRSAVAAADKLVAKRVRPVGNLEEREIDDLAIDLLAAIVEKQAAASRAIAAKLSDVTTGIVVDSFQKVSEKLLELRDLPADEVTEPDQRVFPFDRVILAQVPTNLEMITTNATNYFRYQSAANALERSILEWILARTKDRKALTRFQTFLDSLNEEFAEAAKDAATWEREFQNLSKMVGILLYWKDPREWGKPSSTETSFSQKGDRDVYTNYAFNKTWPAALTDQVLKNILVPGTNRTYLEHYSRLKSQALNRINGPGIDRGRRHSVQELGGNPPTAEDSIIDPKSEYFSAKDTAFFFFQQSMKAIYDQLLSTEYDSFFENLLKQRVPGAPR